LQGNGFYTERMTWRSQQVLERLETRRKLHSDQDGLIYNPSYLSVTLRKLLQSRFSSDRFPGEPYAMKVARTVREGGVGRFAEMVHRCLSTSSGWLQVRILLGPFYIFTPLWIVSSGGERFLDTEEVVGSIPILSISETPWF
jgi:hypothetical protein